VTAGPTPGNETVTAEYADSGSTFDSSSDDESHDLVAMPGPPTNVTTTPGPGRSIVLSATPPQGPPSPTGYQVRCIPVGLPVNTSPADNKDTRWVGASRLPLTVDNLTRNVSYHCKIRARYGPAYTPEAGDKYEGPLSVWTANFKLPVIKPPAPTNVTASTPVKADPRATNVSWTKVVNDTGAPVTFSVRCVSSNGGATKNVTGGPPLRIGSLTPKKTYRCDVRATNSAGSSAWSPSSTFVVP
jgi:hypothetical protein